MVPFPETVPRSRPYVFLNAAMSADGKLAPAGRNFVPFSSRADHDLLLELRTYADAVMCGARTADLTPVTLGIGGEKYRKLRRRHGRKEPHVRIIVSGSGSLDPKAKVFADRFSPIVILTSGRASASRLKQLRNVADEVGVFGGKNLDFVAALKWLREKHKITRLLCEGGGEINAALIESGLVDRIFLTICPMILGGQAAPTLSDGLGFTPLAASRKLSLRQKKARQGDLFLIYDILGPTQ